ncbi:hypothetical protein HK096_008731 [Nowakowskiella sp. JEL0078]|nr:hypothetical protein HK096_008731 [Nowakowskiella sp. JEL0078]
MESSESQDNSDNEVSITNIKSKFSLHDTVLDPDLSSKVSLSEIPLHSSLIASLNTPSADGVPDTALRDAMFVVDDNDKKKVEQVLKKIDKSYDKMLRFNPSWLWKQIKHYIPKPNELLQSVTLVFEKYVPMLCSRTGNKLFSKVTWNEANNLLDTIRRGHFSDPPGVSFYSEIGQDKLGLSIFHCIRGTNSLEGGIHQKIVRRFGAFNASVELAECLLVDFRNRHNLECWNKKSHWKESLWTHDIWLYDEINTQLQCIKLSTSEKSSIPINWVNGQDYIKSNEQFGISRFSLDFCEKFHFKPFIGELYQDNGVKLYHGKIAEMQGTKFAVLPVYTIAEQSLFKLLMTKYISKDLKTLDFNETDLRVLEKNWVNFAIEWNLKSVNGTSIFYKLPEQLERYHRFWENIRFEEIQSETTQQLTKNYQNYYNLKLQTSTSVMQLALLAQHQD